MNDTDRDDVMLRLDWSWDDGYQAAVDKLREMADQLKDPHAVEVVKMLATALESTKKP